jgi:hypothetical protein
VSDARQGLKAPMSADETPMSADDGGWQVRHLNSACSDPNFYIAFIGGDQLLIGGHRRFHGVLCP